MGIQLQLAGARVPIKVWTTDIDNEAINQLRNVANLGIIHGHIAAMPDVHAGIGATVGSVIPTRQAIIPAAVGVDIGCGMNAIRLSLTAAQLPDNLHRLRSALEAAIPVGFEQHPLSKVRGSAHDRVCRPLDARLDALVGKHPGLMKMQRKFASTWRCQMGTLGGGNHFIEVCIDETQQVWLMLHSGSRGIGNVIGRYFITAARRDMERQRLHLPDKDLAYLCAGSTLFDDYVEAVDWAQRYAWLNRQTMLKLAVDVLRPLLPSFTALGEAINCHHNYVAEEEHGGESLYITRKGAISAREGELGIIPGSMGARSYIVRGRGNPDSYCSCSHGAGRRLSRTQARNRYTEADVQEQTQGVECRKDGGVIDEIPAAYKDIEQVMSAQSDLVEVVHTLKQVLCIKG